MKNLLKYSGILFFLVFFSCNDPLPIQVENAGAESVQIEPISNELQTNETIVAYDSTGILETEVNSSNLLFVNGIKSTFEGFTTRQSYYQASFYDASDPIIGYNGKIYGYRLLRVKNVMFDDENAREIENRMRVKTNVGIIDTANGYKYVIYKRFNSGSLNYPYGSSINVKINTVIGKNSLDFDVPTAGEITGQLSKSGTAGNGDLSVTLNWNKDSRNEDEKLNIVILGVKTDGSGNEPLCRLKTVDDGELVVPRDVIRLFNSGDYTAVVFSLIRVKKSLMESGGRFGVKQFYSISQSIHNIKINVR